MRMRPCCTGPRLRYLRLKHKTLIKQKKHKTVNSRTTRAEIRLRGPSRPQVRKKIAKCTQLYFKIRSSELIMLICFMKFTIETKYARKTIFTHIRCRERALQTAEMQMKWLRVDQRRSHNFHSPRCMIPHHLIRSSQSWNSMGRVPSLVVWADLHLIPNINPVGWLLQMWLQ